ncbi:hypothetical protein [Sphingosinicella sp. CPCC 101087]|uniref:hypothetical protein n=1 Tax=Sphingosinicella sp. CPCC 101087 TaxID=2497754 RepID=UPI00101D7244|nr:hypothetical protein [Sphingosinicella sp. CPCC 101087]
MNEAMMTITLSSFGLLALGIPTLAALKGWQGWLEVKRLELTGQGRQEPRSSAMDRIEIADLKERVRKLESIAACIDP